MMYKDKLCCAIKHNKKILREFGDVVKLPFGSEFTILLKNLHNRRAEVAITIDGTDILNNRKLIINANSETELTRFVNDLNSGNSFKFIERTNSIENHRGINIEDGLIKIVFKYEQLPHLYRHTDYLKSPTSALYSSNINTNNVLRSNSSYSSEYRGISTTDSLLSAQSCVNEVGITVPGSINTQQFTESLGFTTELEEHIMIIRLSGITDNDKLINQPITVKTKAKCTTCGKLNKNTNKFCSDCGTSLQVI